MQQIYATSNEIDLQMLVGLLESHGIASRIMTDGAGEYFRTLGTDAAITKRVLVDERDWNRAIQLAKENGFLNQKKIKRDKTEVIASRIVLVIFAIIGITAFLYK